MDKVPCYKCKDRRVEAGYNCHDHCERYKEFQARCKAARDKAKRGVEADCVAHESRHRRIKERHLMRG